MYLCRFVLSGVSSPPTPLPRLLSPGGGGGASPTLPRLLIGGAPPTLPRRCAPAPPPRPSARFLALFEVRCGTSSPARQLECCLSRLGAS